MNLRLVCCVLVFATGLSAPANAQVDVGISGMGLVSVQPINDAYVGGPYLSEGIGGFAAGFGAGVNVIFPGGLVVSAELSTARFEREQSGRLVGGGFPNESVPHTTRLRDALLSGLVGFAHSSGDTRLLLVGGVSMRLDNPTIDGVPREPFETDDYGSLPIALTGGADVLHSFSPRAALLFGARYSFIDRTENHQYLGIGSHVLRVGAGVRIRLN